MISQGPESGEADRRTSGCFCCWSSLASSSKEESEDSKVTQLRREPEAMLQFVWELSIITITKKHVCFGAMDSTEDLMGFYRQLNPLSKTEKLSCFFFWVFCLRNFSLPSLLAQNKDEYLATLIYEFRILIMIYLASTLLFFFNAKFYNLKTA